MRHHSPHAVPITLFGFNFIVNLLTNSVLCIEPDGSLVPMGFFQGRGLILELARQQQPSN